VSPPVIKPGYVTIHVTRNVGLTQYTAVGSLGPKNKENPEVLWVLPKTNSFLPKGATDVLAVKPELCTIHGVRWTSENFLGIGLQTR
jgi:hypothetical protein